MYCVAKSFHSTIRNTIFLEPQLIIVIRVVVSRLSDETRVLGFQLDFQFYGIVKLKIVELILVKKFFVKTNIIIYMIDFG